MDNIYFKNLEHYNRGEKLSDPKIIQRLDKKIRDTKDHITLNNVIDYVIYNREYIAKLDTEIVFYGKNIHNHETIEAIKL